MELKMHNILEDSEKQIIIGWKEWVTINGLRLPPLKAKIDTGAKTSCLHALNIRTFHNEGQPWVSFITQTCGHKQPGKDIECNAPIHDLKTVTNSGGHSQKRYTILTEVAIGEWMGLTEITLSARPKMRYRMLVGRETLKQAQYIVDSSKSYLLEKK